MTNKVEICKFNFSVYWDLYGYFINLKNNSGNGVHNEHPKLHDTSNILIPTRLLDDKEEETVYHVVDSACNKAAGRNYMFRRFGKFISSMKVAYLHCKNNELGNPDDDIHSMLINFENSNEIRFTTLSDVPKQEFFNDDNFSKTKNPLSQNHSITLSTTKRSDGTIINSPVSMLTSIKDIESLAKKERVECNLSGNDILFISIAWTVLPALRLFMLCPEVFWVDVTSHSNNKGFDLLTFSCRTSVGKQCIFFIFTPNQKRFCFRWFFSHAIPLLIPIQIRRRV